MTSNNRRQWQMALATLLIWVSAGLVGSIVQAADENPAEVAEENPAEVSESGSKELADRLDALVDQAAARVGRHGAEGGEPGAEVIALREQLGAAETQIALLKNVVIQALRAQSAAEEALRRERAGQDIAPDLEAARERAGASDLMLADQLEALTATVQRLQAEVDALRSRTPSEPMAEQDAGSVNRDPSSVGMSREVPSAAPAEEDAMFAESGMGGRYEPLIEDEPPGSGRSGTAADSRDPIKVAEVHFNSGSAELTPGGARKTLEAVERIRSMEAAKVRVVAFADRVGGSAYNRVLSQERALSIATVLESGGLPRDMVEVVGSGEEGIPEPTADGVPEPLNRCAGIFVVTDSAG